MVPSDSNDPDRQSRRPAALRPPRTPYRGIRRHKRFSSASYSTEQLAPLPEYHSPPFTTPVAPGHDVSTGVWPTGEPSPPPTYPGLESPKARYAEELEGPGSVPESITTTRAKPRKPLRRRSSVGGTNERLDSLLERSVMALEASTALLQSSLSTHTSLSAIMADSSFDRSMDLQIRYLARRMGAEGEQQDNGLDKVFEEVLGLLAPSNDSDISARNAVADDEAVSRSLPAEDHMQQLRASSSISDAHKHQPLRPAASQRRLRLSDGPRPRSPPPRPFTQYVSVESPLGQANEATSTPSSILLPSTSDIRAPPLESPLSPPLSAPPSLDVHIPPPSPSLHTPASSLLMRIHSRSSSMARSVSPDVLSRSFSAAGFMKRASDRPLKDEADKAPRGRGMGSVRSPAEPSGPLFGTRKTWPQRTRSQSSDQHPSVIRHRITDSTASLPIPSSSHATSPLTEAEDYASGSEGIVKQVGESPITRTPSTSYKVSLSLRKILTESEKSRMAPVSDVASGKQRAAGERPGMDQETPRHRRSSSHRRPPALNTVITPSISQPVLTHDISSQVGVDYLLSPRRESVASQATTASSATDMSVPSTPSTMKRRSALKGSSGRSTPLSSGQSSPRVVTFSPLPPKHESDGSVGRAKAKSKAARAAKAKAAEKEKEDEKRGWWTEWLLGPSESAEFGSRGRQSTPVHTRTGSMLREEGRWTSSGMESWQI